MNWLRTWPDGSSRSTQIDADSSVRNSDELLERDVLRHYLPVAIYPVADRAGQI